MWCRKMATGLPLAGVPALVPRGLVLSTWVLLVVLLACPDVVHGQNKCGEPVSDELKLIQCLFKNYDPAVRPVFSHKDVVNVDVKFLLLKLVELDEHGHTLHATGWLRKSWVDKQLKWEKSDYNGLDVIRIPSARIWTPDLVLYNNAADTYEHIVDKLAELHSDGTVIWIPHVRLRAYCNLKLKHFPFDTQSCMLSFGSWTYDITKVNFTIPPLPERRYVFDGNEWKVTKYTIHKSLWSYSKENFQSDSYPVISLTVTLKRESAFYVSLLVTPSILFATLLIFIFLIPPASGQRLPFAVGILICQTLLLKMLEYFVPTEISDFPIIGVHLVTQMVMTTIAIIMSIASLNCHYRDVSKSKVPTWLRHLLLGWLSRLLCLKPNLYTSLPTDISVLNGGAAELRTADELGLDLNNPSAMKPATINTTLEDIRRYLKALNAKLSEPLMPSSNNPSHHDLVVHEWRQIGLVIDRVLFVIYLVTSIFTLTIFIH